MESKKPVYINITTLTVVKIILVFILFYFLYIIKDILAVLFVSLILASAFHPWVDWMQKKKIPRPVGILFIYLVTFLLFGSVVVLLIPILSEQIGELSNNFSQTFDQVISGFSALKEFFIQHGLLDEIKDYIGTWSASLQNNAGGIFETVSGFFSGVFTFFLVLVMTFYMTVEENAVKKIVWSIAPEKHQVYIMQLISRMQEKIGLWLRGQLILSLVIFVLTYIGLSIVGVKYALVLAFLAAITEFVPYFGPVLASVPAVFIALTDSLMLAIFVVILYSIIQWTENNIIVPKVMQKVVGLNPIVSISVLIIGFKIAWITGAVLSIPVATAVGVVIKDIFDNRMAESTARQS